MAAWPMAWARWLLPVPPGPRNNASSRLPMKAQAARSKTRLRFIFGLKLKSKWSSVFCWIAEGGLFAPPLQQPVAAPGQFVGDQARDEIDGRHGLGLGLAQTRFQHGSDAAEPQLSYGMLQFDDVHSLISFSL